MRTSAIPETIPNLPGKVVWGVMKDRRLRSLQLAVVVCLAVISVAPLLAAMKNWAVIAPAGSKLQDLSLADLAKLCKGTQKAWPDGKNFTIVMHDPESAEMWRQMAAGYECLANGVWIYAKLEGIEAAE